MRPLPAALATLALANPLAAAPCGDVSAAPALVEVVTFRLAPGTDADAFRDAARATTAFLCAAPGFLARTLSVDADGLWTDHMLWSDAALAMQAAETAMTRPEMAPFMAAIDPASMTMRHADFVALD